MRNACALVGATTCLLALGAFTAPAGAVVLGQLDSFESGTTLGWTAGISSPLPPVVMPDGGPSGAGDGFLLLTSTGAIGPGGRLVAFNEEQWTGDYTAAQVRAIGLDVNNLGTSDVILRLVFERSPPAAPPTDVAIGPAVVVPAGSGWRSIVFSITAADLTALEGSAANALAGATRVRIVHGPDPIFPPPPVAAQLGIDNIHAQSEPVAVGEASWGRVKRVFR